MYINQIYHCTFLTLNPDQPSTSTQRNATRSVSVGTVHPHRPLSCLEADPHRSYCFYLDFITTMTPLGSCSVSGPST